MLSNRRLAAGSREAPTWRRARGKRPGPASRIKTIEGLQPREYFDCNPPGTGHYTYQLWKEGRDPETGRLVDSTLYAELGMNPGDNRDNIASDYLSTGRRDHRRAWPGRGPA